MNAFPDVPMPPIDLSAPYSLSLLFTAICSVIFIGLGAYLVYRAVKGDALGMFCLIGGLCAGVLEPMLDYLGLLWFANDNAYIAVATFHRHVPLYVVLGYGFFFGWQAYMAFQGALLGRSRAWFWKFFALSWVFDFALQATGANLGLYQYYGPQPYLILGAPAWWFTIDASFPALFATVMLGLRAQLNVRGGSLLVIPLIPALYAGLNAAAGWPVFTSLNSASSMLINYICSTLTILLAVLVQCVCVEKSSRAST